MTVILTRQLMVITIMPQMLYSLNCIEPGKFLLNWMLLDSFLSVTFQHHKRNCKMTVFKQVSTRAWHQCAWRKSWICVQACTVDDGLSVDLSRGEWGQHMRVHRLLPVLRVDHVLLESRSVREQSHGRVHEPADTARRVRERHRASGACAAEGRHLRWERGVYGGVGFSSDLEQR